MIRYVRALGALSVVAFVAACGAHGSSIPPVRPVAPQRGFIKATLFIPATSRQTAAMARYARAQQARHAKSVKPQYLSGNTTELDFVLNSNNGNAATAGDQASFDFTIYTSDSQNCSGSASTGYTCSVTAPAPVGTDTYKVSSYQCSVSGTNSSTSCTSGGGSLSLLGMSFATVNVVYNQTVVAAFTLSPVVASIDWAPVSYARANTSTNNIPSGLWLTSPNGPNVPKYTAAPSPGSYSCTSNVGSGFGNGCYEPVAQGTSIAYGEVLEARDASGAVIIGASGGGTVYQTPVYLDQNGNAIAISWSCKDNVIGGKSITFETGGGPYASNASAVRANQYFNSPVVDPSSDPDGGYTTDGNGNPVTAVGNNGVEINWDGVDQPILDSPDFCTATTSNGLKTTLNFFAGLGSGGVTWNPTPSPAPTFGPGMYILSSYNSSAPATPDPVNAGALVYYANPQGSLSTSQTNPYSPPPTQVFTLPGSGTDYSGKIAVNRFSKNGDAGTVLWVSGTYVSNQQNFPFAAEYETGHSAPVATLSGAATLLQSPQSVALDSSGQVYILDSGCTCIYVYPSSANGNVAPVRTISGLTSNNMTPHRIFIDQQDDLWVEGPVFGNATGYTNEFSVAADGTATLLATAHSPCYDVEPDGSLVCTSVNSSTRAYNVDILSPSNGFSKSFTYPTTYTRFDQPYIADIATDASGFIYVTGCTCGTASSGVPNDAPVTTIFEPYTSGVSTAYATLSGANTGVYQPTAIAVLGGSLPTPAPTATPQFAEYPIPTASSVPIGIAKGSDGALWFTEQWYAANKIGRITTAGAVTEYPIPTAFSNAIDIAAGPDGALWFTENSGSADRIGRITTAGAITEYTIPSPGRPSGIAAGPDGALWFALNAGGPDQIGRIGTNGTITEYPIPTASAGPSYVTTGPDNALWFTESTANKIGRITTSGAITEYPIPTASSSPLEIANGPDGAVWFTESNANKIGRITTSGVVTEYVVPTSFSEPGPIVAGPDGALWFSEILGDKLGRITTSGVITEHPIPTVASYPEGLTVGPDGALWFTESAFGANKIGRFTP